MRILIFGVRDAKAEAYIDQPFFMTTKGLAIRGFSDMVNKEGNNLNSHPEDFALYHLGEFDPHNGRIFPLEIPLQIATALDLKVQPNA